MVINVYLVTGHQLFYNKTMFILRTLLVYFVAIVLNTVIVLYFVNRYVFKGILKTKEMTVTIYFKAISTIFIWGISFAALWYALRQTGLISLE